MKDDEAIKLLWEEYKLRQTHYWSSFNRFALSILTISVIPYIKPDIVKPLGKVIVVFPIVAFILSIGCTWLLSAEYQRLRMVREKYDELLTPEFQPSPMPRETFWEKIVEKRIGITTSLMFGLGFTFLSLINTIVLLYIPIGG